jgi:3-hydroxyacyl-[acyl-carrier-protein] dehydratase
MRLEYFQLIDQIVEIDLDTRVIRTVATVPATSTIFEGHFPGHPLMPGVLLIEAMAQTAGWLVIAATAFNRMAFLAAVKEAKLRAFVKPGQLLEVSASLLHEGSGYTVAASKISVNGKSVCNAELTFRVVEFPNPEVKSAMQQWGERLGFPMGALADG